MRFLDIFLPRHRRFAELASAYTDGELRGGELRRFEAHLAACARCKDAVDAGRALKLHVSQMPEVPAPRSFRLTPQMVAAAGKPKWAVGTGTPLYLNLARAGAALSVGAFATVLSVGAFDSDGQADMAASGNTREIQLSAEDTSAGSDALATPEQQPNAPEARATPTPGPAIAPASGGGASGAGLESPTVRVESPQPPRTGADTPPDTQPTQDNYNYDDGAPKNGTSNDTIEPRPGVISVEPFAGDEEGDGGANALTVALGGLAVASVLVLGGLEVRRRRS